MSTQKLLPIADVLAATAVSRRTIYRWITEGTFPPPVRLGARSARWVESEIDAWIDAKFADRAA